jgi:1,4-dihydroxy-2-naphthoate octaprenyltransferase
MPEHAHADDAPSSYAGALLQAARPRTLPAAATPVIVGSALAYANGVFDLVPAFVALAGALLIQVGTNFANDYFDYKKGADTEDRVGETRVTQAGLADPSDVKLWMATAFGLAVLVGGYLVAVGGWPIVAIGLASVAAGILYTGGPWPFGYHGLGDVFVFAFFGLIAVTGTYYVQALTWPIEAWLAGAGIGALSTNILVVNNLRDVDTDREAGKHTLAVILGRNGARIEYALLLALALAVPAIGVAYASYPSTAILAVGAGVLALPPLGTVLRTDDPAKLDDALQQTARVLLAYGLLFSIGVVL